MLSIGLGFFEFFDKPIEGFIKGPIEGAIGIGKGTASLVKNTLSGTSNSISVFTNSLALIFSTLSLVFLYYYNII
jgi:vacuolar protein sorting-associated protein 13A/C